MSDTQDPNEYVRDRLAEHLDGLGYTIETTDHGAQLTAEGGPMCQTVTVGITARGLLDIDSGELIAFPGFSVRDAFAEAPGNDTLMRRVASEWHNGQTSALYAFVSTGSISAATLIEIDHELKGLDPSDGYASELRSLRAYVSVRGSRGPVRGWSALDIGAARRA